MQHNTQHIELAKRFLANKNVALEHEVEKNEYADGTGGTTEHLRFEIAVNDRIWTDGTGIWHDEGKKGAVKAVSCDSLSLIAIKDDSEGENAYWSGGLAGYCYYDGTGKDGTWCDGEELDCEEKGGLINGMKREGTGDGYIYTDGGFVDNLRKYMTEQCDFDAALFDYLDFDYSEQGMQQEGAVNFDVEMEGDFWKAVKAEQDEDTLKLQAKAFA